MVDRRCRAARTQAAICLPGQVCTREKPSFRLGLSCFVRRAAARFGVAALVSLALAGTLAAQDRAPPYPLPPSQKCFLFLFCSLPSTPGANWQLFDRSGRLGRQGLGASPFHPEGPGNASY